MANHGTITKYREPCRCELCTKANTTYARAYRERLRNDVWQIKQNPCMDCGGRFHPVAMTFDHRPGEEKIDDISTLVRYGHRKKVFAEIEKCDLVCFNCHQVRTWERSAQAWREDHRSKQIWESSSRQILNNEAAMEIYRLTQEEPRSMSYREIAERFGVSTWTVSDIARKKRWRGIHALT